MERSAVRSRLEARGARVLDSLDTVANALVVDWPTGEVTALEQIPGVRKVYRDVEIRLKDEAALALHNVPQAWERVGGSLFAGAGILIGVIDTGVDNANPAFLDATMTPPPGYPRFRRESDRPFTNGKVIVARSYEDLLGVLGPTAQDRYGHGTAVAGVAAGALQPGPFGGITGVAPKAWIGSYKVFSGATQATQRSSSSVVARALEDAVNDGMEIINLSLGSSPALDPQNDFLVSVVNRVSSAGVVVVAAAGNSGPNPGTVESPGTAAAVLAVGATRSSRILSTAVTLEGRAPVAAVAGNGPVAVAQVSGVLRDVETLDRTGLACEPLPAGSLQGRIALVLRGVCNFSVKLTNAGRAGAVGAVIYTDEARPDAIPMDVEGVGLPAIMVSYGDGSALKASIAEAPELSATIDLRPIAVPADPNRMATFSSRGPAALDILKPELSATGASLFAPVQTNNPGGGLYDASGFRTVDGTSFSAPMVAGAAAVVKANRLGLAAAQYRSLLVNSARPVNGSAGLLGPMQAGAGSLDLSAALETTLTAEPVALSFGLSQGSIGTSRELTVTNTGTESEPLAVRVTVLEGTSQPVADAATFTLAPGASRKLTLSWTASGLTPGASSGWIVIRSEANGREIKIPYWHGVVSRDPGYLTVYGPTAVLRAGEQAVFTVRVTDALGIGQTGVTPRVRVVSGGGTVQNVAEAAGYPAGYFDVTVRLGPVAGANVLAIEAGELAQQLSIRGN